MPSRETVIEFMATVFASIALLVPTIAIIFFTLAQNVSRGLVESETERYIEFIAPQFVFFIPKQANTPILESLKKLKEAYQTDTDMQKRDQSVVESNNKLITLAIIMCTSIFAICSIITILLWVFLYRFPLIPFLVNVILAALGVALTETLMIKFMSGKFMPIDMYTLFHNTIKYAQEKTTSPIPIPTALPNINNPPTGMGVNAPVNNV